MSVPGLEQAQAIVAGALKHARDNDEAAAIAGIEAAGFKADPGAD